MWKITTVLFDSGKARRKKCGHLFWIPELGPGSRVEWKEEVESSSKVEGVVEMPITCAEQIWKLLPSQNNASSFCIISNVTATDN